MASRINFKTIIAKYARLGKANVRLTQSSLYLTKPINPATTVYNFDVLETQTATLSGDETRLNLNDEFIVASMSMGIECRLKVAETTLSGKFLLTYAPFEQNVTAADGISSFYDGNLQISVNNVVYLDKYDVRRSQITPTTEFSNLAAAGVTASIPSIDWSKDSFYGNEPLLTLAGSKKNQIQITLPRAMTALPFAFTDNSGSRVEITPVRVFWFARGLNAQNASVFQN